MRFGTWHERLWGEVRSSAVPEDGVVDRGQHEDDTCGAGALELLDVVDCVPRVPDAKVTDKGQDGEGEEGAGGLVDHHGADGSEHADGAPDDGEGQGGWHPWRRRRCGEGGENVSYAGSSSRCVVHCAW